jgi:hypothetical protein
MDRFTSRQEGAPAARGWCAHRLGPAWRRDFPPLLGLAGLLAGLAAPVQPARAHLISFLEPAQLAHVDSGRYSFSPLPPTGLGANTHGHAALALFDGVSVRSFVETTILGPSPDGALNDRSALDLVNRRFVLQRSKPEEAPFAKVAFSLDVDGRMAIGSGTTRPPYGLPGVVAVSSTEARISTILTGGLLTTLYSLQGSFVELLGMAGSAPQDHAADQFKAIDVMLTVGIEYILTAWVVSQAFTSWDGSTPTYATADFYTGDNGADARLTVVPEPSSLMLLMAALGVAAWATRRP